MEQFRELVKLLSWRALNNIRNEEVTSVNVLDSETQLTNFQDCC